MGTTEELVQLARAGNTKSSNRKPRFSASTIGSYLKCERTWFWEYVVGIEPEQTGAQSFGTSLHSIAEEYLKRGTLPSKFSPEGKVFSPGMQYLPTPGTEQMFIEQSFKLKLWPNAPEVTGTVDLFVAPYDNLDENETDSTEPSAPIKLYDHKTTSDFKWALKADDFVKPKLNYVGSTTRLCDDTQACLYAAALLRMYPRAPSVEATWVYYRKNSHPSAMVVTTIFTRESLKGKLAEIAEAVEEMAAMLSTLPPLSTVPARTSHCEAYRGCAHKARCFATAAERTKTIFGGIGEANTMSFRDELEKQMNKAKTPAPLNRATITPPPKLNGGSPAAKLSQAKPVAPQAAAPKPVAAPAAVAKPLPIARKAVAAPPPPAPEPEVVEEEEILEAASDVPDVAEYVEETVAEEAVEAPVVKRGRKPKAQATSGGFWLFVNATPVKGGQSQLKNIEDFVGPIAKRVADELQLPHYGLAEYGKGPAYLAAAISMELDNAPLDGAYYLDKASPTAKAALDVFTQRAAVVVQSV